MKNQYTARMVRQAIKDDQGLSSVAGDIHVSVKDGIVALDGQATTNQHINLATNTAAAVAVNDNVKNRMEISH